MNGPQRFRKRPVEIEAVLYTGMNQADVHEFVGRCAVRYWGRPGMPFYLQTLEGDMRAEPGDWIIKGVDGEFYPCKPDIFEQTYEAVA